MPRRSRPPIPDSLAFLTQTTLSVDDTAEIVAMLRRRFPSIARPRSEDICYATSNRQAAVKAIAGALRRDAGDRLAQQLQFAAPGRGRRARGRPRRGWSAAASDIDFAWLEGVRTLGITAGASAPEVLVREVVDRLAARFDVPRSRSRASRSGWSSSSPRGPRSRLTAGSDRSRDLHRRRLQGQSRPGRLGRRDPLGRAREGDFRRRAADHQQPDGAARRDPRRSRR